MDIKERHLGMEFLQTAYRAGNTAILKHSAENGYCIEVIIRSKADEFKDEAGGVLPAGTEIPILIRYDPPAESPAALRIELLDLIRLGVELYANNKDLAHMLREYLGEVIGTGNIIECAGQKIKLTDEKWLSAISALSKEAPVYSKKTHANRELFIFVTRKEKKAEPSVEQIKEKIAGRGLIVPKEVLEYEDGVLYPASLVGFLKEGGFDEEEHKDFIAYKRERDGYLEEFRFDKDVIFNGEGEESRPNLKGMKRDLRETITLAIVKQSNPVEWFPQEVFKGIRGIKAAPGSLYARKKQDHIHLAAMRYLKWAIRPDGKLDLRIIQQSPYTRVEFPDNTRGAIKTWINSEFLQSVDIRTGEINKGKFKSFPAPTGNPYRRGSVKHKALEWLTRDVKGRNLTISTKRILGDPDKLSLSKQLLQRKEYCFKKIYEWLGAAIEHGFDFAITADGKELQQLNGLVGKYGYDKFKKTFETEGRKIQDPDLFGDPRRWKIEFFSPVEVKGELSKDGERLLDEIIQFIHYDNNFKVKNPEGKNRRILQNMLLNRDIRTARSILEEIKSQPLFSEIEGKTISSVAILFDRLKTLSKRKKGVHS